MKGFGFVLLSLPFFGVAQANPLNDAIHSVSQAYGEHVTGTMWRNRCSRPEALRLHANCYRNPDGVALWEMSGPEREKWKSLAIQKSVRLQQEHRRQIEVAKEQGQRSAEEHTLNEQMCDFWMQQAESNKKTQKISEYCR